MAAPDSRFPRRELRVDRAGPEHGAEVSHGAGSSHLHKVARASRPSVCVIGAGCSGLTALKALADAGLQVDGYESGDRVGGNWVFGNTNGQSNIYRSLHINTSRERMQFRDFSDARRHAGLPAPRRRRALLRELRGSLRSQVENLVSHTRDSRDSGRIRRLSSFTLERRDQALRRRHGRERTPLGSALPRATLPWKVRRHRAPFSRLRELQRAADDLRGKRVLVVGIGNSAVDIACELGHPGVAERVLISMRRGAWVLPKYAFGKPIDQTGAVPSLSPLAHEASAGRGDVQARRRQWRAPTGRRARSPAGRRPPPPFLPISL